MQAENRRGGAAKRAATADGPDPKRRRSGGPEGVFGDLLAEAGCELISSRAGQEYEVADPHALRRALERKLTLNRELVEGFLEGLEQHLAPDEVLHAALKPMTVTGANVPITGDSFIRVLLSISVLQAKLAELLLDRLAACSGGEGGEEQSIAQLILGQFRWLDLVVDPRALTSQLLERLDVCPGEVMREAITFLPEIAQEEDHEAVLEKLHPLMESESSLIPPVVEALSNLSLEPELQARAVEMVLDRLQAAEPGDLPTVVRYLLQHAAPGEGLKTVVAKLRASLHFVSPGDPRLTVPDRKQKGKVLSATESVEGQTLDNIRQALQLSPAAADAVAKELRSVGRPDQHKPLDFWLLLLLMSLGPERRKAGETLLRSKLGKGAAEPAWLERAVAGQHARMLADHFPTLLSLGQQLLRVATPEVQAGGVVLFTALFTHFTDAFHQQEVLRTLHGHLGERVGSEVSAALDVLSRLSREQTSMLLRYAAFLTGILNYVDGYSDAQVHQTFAVFSELVADACRQADEGGGGSSRMEDELPIFLRKQLSSSEGSHRRVGIIGTVALVRRLAAATSDGAETEGAIGKRYHDAMDLLKKTFQGCQEQHEAFAFLCDELSRGLAHEAVSGKLLEDLSSMVTDAFEQTYVMDREGGGGSSSSRGQVEVGSGSLAMVEWWNLDGSNAQVALKLLSLVALEVAPGPARPGQLRSASLVPLFSTIRLLAELELAKQRSLGTIDAVLGCPLSLFPQSLVDPGRFAGLEAAQESAVLLGLWYSLNWLREVANAFARQMGAGGESAGGLELKLFARLRQACQLEVVLDSLLPLAPPLFHLPALGSTLPSSAAAGGALALLSKKAPHKAIKKKAAAGKKNNNKKKGSEEEDSMGPAPTGRADTQLGGSTTTQAQSSTTTQAAGAQAAVAAARGLGHLATERWKLRSLQLQQLRVLAGMGSSVRCFAMLPPAAYLLAELLEKLQAVLPVSKRAGSFPGKAGIKSHQFAAQDSLTACQVLDALKPVLPALRIHMDAALAAVGGEDLDDDAMAEQDQQNVWDCVHAATQQGSHGPHHPTVAACLDTLDCAAARAATSPSAAASQVLELGLECIKRLVQWPGLVEPQHRGILQALLLAFGDSETGASQGLLPDQALLAACRPFFIWFNKHAVLSDAAEDGGAAGRFSFSHHHSVLQIRAGCVRLARELGGDPHGRVLRKMGAKVAAAAEEMLQKSWAAPEDTKNKSGGWRGHSDAMHEAVMLKISLAEEPLQEISGLAELMGKVGKPGKEQECVDPYPSLTASTVGTWYRAAFEALQAHWDKVVEKAVAAAKGIEQCDEECVASIVAGCQQSASSFRELLEIMRCHNNRVAVLSQAVRAGGKFVDAFFKVLPFWSAVLSEREDDFTRMVKDMQKGTRLLQAVCGEGKSGSILPLAAKVPLVKKSLERFVFLMKAFMTEAHGPKGFWFGQLKHRDISGKVVDSQLLPGNEDQESAEEEEDMDDEEEEEEDSGETQADE